VIERRFRFAWSRTWPDRPQDFTAADGERRIGRVYRLTGVDERWKWSMTAAIGNRLGSTSGIAATRDEACDAVERHYEAMKAAIPVKDQG
jgi:hypothetical protein